MLFHQANLLPAARLACRAAPCYPTATVYSRFLRTVPAAGTMAGSRRDGEDATMAAALSGTVTLLDAMAFTATAGSGNVIQLDSSPDHGGAARGAQPMELLLLALGGCTGMDVISLLRKMRQEVSSYQVELLAKRAEEHPRIMTDISVVHVVRGRSLDPQLIRRAITLSATRYCPASAMLSKAAVLHHRCRIVDEATGTAMEGDVVDTPLPTSPPA
jgi:putative redox protein